MNVYVGVSPCVAREVRKCLHTGESVCVWQCVGDGEEGRLVSVMGGAGGLLLQELGFAPGPRTVAA